MDATGGDAEADGPPRFSRRWFGAIFFGAWGLLAIITLPIEVFGWERRGLPYWLAVGPLIVLWIAAGVPWIALATRDLVEARAVVWLEIRVWILALVAVVAAAFAAGLVVDALW